MNTDPCFCSEHLDRRFQGNAPMRIAGIVIDNHDARYPDVWRVHCERCATRWLVALIPGGGIYGDFDWDGNPE